MKQFKDNEEFEDFDFETDLELDPMSLDVEWIDQSKLYMQYAEACAHAVKMEQKKHERVKTIRSELILEANEGGEKLIGIKPTVSTIEAWYRIQPKYKEAKKEWHEAEYSANLFKSALTALTNKKVALENLVRLWLGEYFSGPKTPRDIESIMQKKSRTARNAITEKLNRKNNKRGVNTKG